MTDHGTTVTVGGVTYRVQYVFVSMPVSWERWELRERRWWAW